MRASGYDRVADDWYVEPEHTVRSLFGVERFHGLVWDPCCGSGNIPRVASEYVEGVVASDIADRGYGEMEDFLTSRRVVTSIIANPPYGIIEEFILHALKQTDHKVCVLARLAFLESQRRYHHFWPRVPLARVWVSSRRLSMPPGASDVEAKGGTIAYAWFVLEHGHKGAWQGGWLP